MTGLAFNPERTGDAFGPPVFLWAISSKRERRTPDPEMEVQTLHCLT